MIKQYNDEWLIFKFFWKFFWKFFLVLITIITLIITKNGLRKSPENLKIASNRKIMIHYLIPNTLMHQIMYVSPQHHSTWSHKCLVLGASQLGCFCIYFLGCFLTIVKLVTKDHFFHKISKTGKKWPLFVKCPFKYYIKSDIKTFYLTDKSWQLKKQQFLKTLLFYNETKSCIYLILKKFQSWFIKIFIRYHYELD